MAVKRIPQRTIDDCAICSVAMVLGFSYERVLRDRRQRYSHFDDRTAWWEPYLEEENRRCRYLPTKNLDSISSSGGGLVGLLVMHHPGLRAAHLVAIDEIGVVDPSDGFPVVGADPLGRVVPIAICDRCRGIDERPGPACRNCGSSQDYRVVDLAIPAGFRTNWRLGESYDGTQARRSRTSVPRLAIDFDGTTEYSDGGFAIRSGRTRLFVVNDNHRTGFHFYEVPGWDGLLNEAAVPDGLRGSAGEPIHVALGAARVTDVLIAAAARSTDGSSTGREIAPWPQLGQPTRAPPGDQRVQPAAGS